MRDKMSEYMSDRMLKYSSHHFTISTTVVITQRRHCQRVWRCMIPSAYKTYNLMVLPHSTWVDTDADDDDVVDDDDDDNCKCGATSALEGTCFNNFLTRVPAQAPVPIFETAPWELKQPLFSPSRRGPKETQSRKRRRCFGKGWQLGPGVWRILEDAQEKSSKSKGWSPYFQTQKSAQAPAFPSQSTSSRSPTMDLFLCAPNAAPSPPFGARSKWVKRRRTAWRPPKITDGNHENSNGEYLDVPG